MVSKVPPGQNTWQQRVLLLSHARALKALRSSDYLLSVVGSLQLARGLLRSLPFSVVMADLRGMDQRQHNESVTFMVGRSDGARSVFILRANDAVHGAVFAADACVLYDPDTAVILAVPARLAGCPRAAAPASDHALQRRRLVDLCARACGYSMLESIVAHDYVAGRLVKEIAGELGCSQRRVELMVQSAASKARCDPSRDRRAELFSGMLRMAVHAGLLRWTG
jgi:DNA-binding NarL/FixJ family response regulator